MPLIVFTILFFAGCQHLETTKKQTPKAYFNNAVYYKKKSNYPRALEHLKNLREKFFYSSYNQKALLLTSDIYFAQKDFPKAIKFYEQHLNLYPNNQKDYVLYQIALAYSKQLPRRAEHDLILAEPALKALKTIVSLKKSTYKDKAQKLTQTILNKKAERELKTALFFKKQGWHQASLNRIHYFTKHYPNSPLMPQALLTGLKLTKTLKQNSKSFKNQLINKYPQSKEAKTLK